MLTSDVSNQLNHSEDDNLKYSSFNMKEKIHKMYIFI